MENFYINLQIGGKSMEKKYYFLLENGEEVVEILKRENVEYVQILFTDILGIPKTVTVTIDEMENIVKHGGGRIGFDGSSITGFQDIEESDLLLCPDWKTTRILPWNPQIAVVIADVKNPDGTPYEGDPRYVLKRMLEKAKQKGFTYYVGPELEYFYFKSDKNTDVLDYGGYFDLTTLDVAQPYKLETAKALKQMGIHVEYTHHEVALSQHEIDIRYDDALAMADKVLLVKIAVKEIAAKNGVYATFMPKPIFGTNGSGMHTHQSLFKGNENAFFSPDSKDHLSDIAKSFIAGILKYAKETCVVLASTVNSYKRLVPGYEAPVYIAWSHRNRSALIRVPMYQPGKEKATRIEVRHPDPAGNPYLQFAVMLGAGLKGIEEKLTPPEPMEINLYHLTDEERKAMGIESLPGSLGEAIAEAEKSSLLKEILGEHVFNRFLTVKKMEWDEYRIRVTPYELQKYLPIY